MPNSRPVAALACIALAGCVPPAPEPTPAPPAAVDARTIPQAAPPAGLALPPPSNWMDVPQTPGDWHYNAWSGWTAASFGPPQAEAQFSVRCDRGARQVALLRAGEAEGPVPMRVLTETRERVLTASSTGEDAPYLAATLPSRDPLLDAMAFSKGRFAVSVAGAPSLYLPSWPEVSRVIEDCR